MNEDVKIIINYRIEKAIKSLDEAEYLINGNMWNLTVNRLYYSCYYSIIALLLCIEQSPKTHKGARNLFHQHFIATGIFKYEFGELLTILFDARQEGDYKDFVEFDSSDVLPWINLTKEFVKSISQFIYSNYFNIDK
ncbi:MAG: hypothetical protein HW421_1204 [Ignavibacteria bacterium]|nr:hypothetical protein [Ignavibacteria bacterium]